MNKFQEELRERYSRMDDEELIKLVTSRELTEEARAVIVEVIKTKNISDAEITKRAENIAKQTELAQTPSLEKVERAWKRVNNALIYLLAMLVFLIVIKELTLFERGSMPSDLCYLAFVGFLIYFVISLGFLISALKRSVLGWYLLSLFFPIPFGGMMIAYCVMYSSVQKVRKSQAYS